MLGRFENVATRAAEAASYIRPEMLALPQSRLQKLLAARELRPFRLLLERVLRFKPHTLGKKEEELLAMQGEMAQTGQPGVSPTARRGPEVRLCHQREGRADRAGNATFCNCCNRPSGTSARRRSSSTTSSSHAHENTLAATLSGSIQSDVYYARARGYDSALAAALFPDHVPRGGLRQLDRRPSTTACPPSTATTTCGGGRCGCKDIHHYDTYVPILTELETCGTPGTRPSQLVLDALQPLGERVLRPCWHGGCAAAGAIAIPNRGKQSGAFSSRLVSTAIRTS